MRMQGGRWAKAAATLATAWAVTLVGLGADAPGSRAADQKALKEYAGLVGEWKGTGLPKRGQNKGAWTESARWAWKLSADSAALVLEVDKGKYLRSATLKPGRDPDTFQVDATLADGSARHFEGKGEPGKPLILRAPKAEDGLARVTLTMPNAARFLLLLEGATEASTSAALARLGEVGYTRQGVAFAAAGATGPECIVTGGRGTIKVSHAGKDYYVCCTGCRDLFQADPAAVLAEAAAKSKEKEKEKDKK